MTSLGPDESSQIVFPLNQADRAWQPDVRNLLARDVYRDLHSIIMQRVAEAPKPSEPFLDRRQHNAILIDGARGTGKSSVLVNLPKYLAQVNRQLAGDVHILKPVDPTLLEDHDDLFLNVVIAAVISDPEVIKAMNNSDQRMRLHKQLQALGHALESIQTQREKKGLDRIRAFIGNHEIIEKVHTFLAEVLHALGRKLLVLPIDDVDTSLDRAFENLEVVRRYLTSPLVLPIISGDASLYHEVTWREFHGRLLKETKWEASSARERAEELADEYQRKILPLQYRLRMPDVDTYLTSRDIALGEQAGYMTMAVLHQWLETLLNDRTNGIENSHLPVPVHTVRALAQLVNRMQEPIRALKAIVDEFALDDEAVRHYFLMKIPHVAVLNFWHYYPEFDTEGDDNKMRIRRAEAYRIFQGMRAEPESSEHFKKLRAAFEDIDIDAWITALHEHFRSDAHAGAAFLVLDAAAHWRSRMYVASVFDTPLFQPLEHADKMFEQFTQDHQLDDWVDKLQGKAQAGWLRNLPKQTILPYPVPEVGTQISAEVLRIARSNNNDAKSHLLFELCIHRNFYNTSKASGLVCIGRIFELVITSLLRDVFISDLSELLTRAPFYSLAQVASTKTITLRDEPGAGNDENTAHMNEGLEAALAVLAEEINGWRSQCGVDNLRLSPWLVYNVMNKTFNQAAYFNSEAFLAGREPFDAVLWTVRKAFNCIWAAFGSFEKGPVYGLPRIVATVNVGDGREFSNSDLYRQNITPFVGDTTGASEFGKAVGSITHMLASHPLKMMTDGLPWPGDAPEEELESTERGDWLKSKIGSSRITAATYKRLRRMKRPLAEVVLREYEELFRDKSDLRDQFNVAFPSSPEDSSR
jgi:hypothetical protein